MPVSQEQLYTAIRNADAAGDTAAVKALLGTLNGGGSDAAPKQQVKGQVSWEDGKYTAETSHAVDASPEERQQLAFDALTKKYPGVQFPKPETIKLAGGQAPNADGSFGTFAKHLATNVLKGAYSLPDLLAEGGNAAGNALMDAGSFLATGGGASSGTVGDPSSSDRVANVFQSGKTSVATAGQALDRNDPAAAGVPGAFGQQMLGGMIMPGPKLPSATPKFGFNPIAQAEARSASPLVSNALSQGQTDAEGIVATGQREGVRVMTSDVRPPTTFVGKALRAMAEKIPVVGTGGVLGPGGRAAQQEERIAAAGNLVKDFAGDGTSADAVNAVTADLSATRKAAVQNLTGIKKRILRSLPGEVPAPLTLKAIDDQIATLADVDTAAAKTVIGKLRDWRTTLQSASKSVDTGLLDADGKSIIRTVPPSGKSLKTIELLRKEMGDAFKGDNAAEIRSTGEAALKSIYGPMREDMGAFIKANGGTGAHAQWKKANDELAAMAGELDATNFKRALQKADLTPEGAAKLIFSKTPSDIKRLAGNLSPAGLNKAQSAIIHKVAEDATENGVISPIKFKSGLAKVDDATGIFFNPEAKARIDGLQRLLEATGRASEASVMPNNGAQAIPYMLGGAGLAHPYLLGSIGVAGRIYESGPVRNLLLRLGRTTPGSKQEAAVMDTIGKTLQKLVPRLAAPAAVNSPANDALGVFMRSPGNAAAQDKTN